MNRREARFQKKLQKYKGKKRLQMKPVIHISKPSNKGHTKSYDCPNVELR